jgi:hypothetical protein
MKPDLDFRRFQGKFGISARATRLLEGSGMRGDIQMKRIFLGMVAAAFVAFGVGLTPASASTINVTPPDSFHVGNLFATAQGVNDTYQFMLSANADMTTVVGDLTTNNISLSLSIEDPSHNLVSFTNLLANVLYTLHVAGFSGNLGAYGGDIHFAAAVTPLPAGLLLFVTSLGGLGALGLRRRSLPTA